MQGLKKGKRIKSNKRESETINFGAKRKNERDVIKEGGHQGKQEESAVANMNRDCRENIAIGRRWAP